MSAPSILISTFLVVLLVLAVALTVGSLALFVAGTRKTNPEKDPGALYALKLLDKPWTIERMIYRHHRLFGLVILFAGVFCIWQMSRTRLIELLGDSTTLAILVGALLIGQAFNLAIGLVMLLRPSLLKPLEAVGNRWHDLDLWDRQKSGNTRLTATLLALVGVIVLVGSATLLVQQLSGSLT